MRSDRRLSIREITNELNTGFYMIQLILMWVKIHSKMLSGAKKEHKPPKVYLMGPKMNQIPFSQIEILADKNAIWFH